MTIPDLSAPARRPSPLAMIAVGALWLIAALTLLFMRPQASLLAVVPNDGELGRQAAFFEDQASSQLIAIEVEGPPAAARSFLDQLVPKLAPWGAQPLIDSDSIGAASAPQLLNQLYDHLPLYLPLDTYDELSDRLSTSALDQRLSALSQWLRRPGNEVSIQAALRDILGLSHIPMAALEALNSDLSALHQRRGSWLVHDQGQHVLALWQVDFPPSDHQRGTALIAAINAQQGPAREQGLQLRTVGAYRHFVENNQAVINDMLLTIPISVLLIIAVLWTFFRSWRILLAIHLPAIAALLGGLAAITWWYGGQVPMMALAFAPAVIGISVDYGIHMAGACRAGVGPQIRPALVVGWLTAATAFLALLLSHFPLIAGLGILVAAGLTMAVLTTLVFIPPLIPEHPDRRQPWPHLSKLALAIGHRRPWLALAVAGLISVLALPGLSRLSLSRDLSALDASTAATTTELAAVTQRWGRLGGSDFWVIQAATVSALMDQLSAIDHPSARALTTLFPSPSQQQQRLTAWNQFWHRHQATFDQHLEQAAEQAGIRSAALAASRQRYQPQTATPSPPPEHPLLNQLHSTWIRHVHDTWQVQLPVLIPDEQALGAWLATHPQDSQQFLASRRHLAQLLTAELADDMLRLFTWMGAAMVVVVCLALRSLRQGLVVAMVPAGGVLWAFGLLGWLGMTLTPMHLLIAGFACGVGIDDGVFYRKGAQRAHSVAPMLATTVTSCLALATLLGGQHPAIRDVALAVLVTMVSCLGVCLLIMPALTPPVVSTPSSALPPHHLADQTASSAP